MGENDIRNAIIASQEGRYDEAIILFKQVIGAGEASDVVLYHLARSLFKMKRFSESVGYWEELLTRYTETKQRDVKVQIETNLASTLYMAAKEEFEAGRYHQASELLAKYSGYYPGKKKVKAMLATLEELGHLSAAAEHINTQRWSEASDAFLAIVRQNKP